MNFVEINEPTMGFSQMSRSGSFKYARKRSTESSQCSSGEVLTSFPPPSHPEAKLVKNRPNKATGSGREQEVTEARRSRHKRAESRTQEKSEYFALRSQLILRPKPLFQNIALSRQGPENDIIQSAQSAQSARGTSRVSDSIPGFRDQLSDTQNSINLNQGQDQHLQVLESPNGEPDKNAVDQCWVHSILQCSPKNSEPVSILLPEDDNRRVSSSGSQQRNLPELPYISSGPPLTQSVESALPQILVMVPSHGSTQSEYDGLEPVSDLTFGSLSKEHANSIDDAAASLPTILEIPRADINNSDPPIGINAPREARRNSRLVAKTSILSKNEIESSKSNTDSHINPVGVKPSLTSEFTALHSNPPDSMIPQITTTVSNFSHRKYGDSSNSRSVLESRLDSESNTRTRSSSANERPINRLAPCYSLSNAHKLCLNSSEDPISSSLHNPEDRGQASSFLEDDEDGSPNQKGDRDDSNVANLNTYQNPRIVVQGQPSSLKPELATVPPSQTRIRARKQRTSVALIKRELLPPWAVGSTALSRK